MPTISAIEGLVIVLYVFAILGALRLITLSHPNNVVSQALLLLY